MIISYAQALLILIDIYKNDIYTVNKLKKLYIAGINEVTDAAMVINMFNQVNSLASEYEISSEPAVINEDPSRRYFETHLAYETLIDSLDQLDIYDIQAHYNLLFQSLPTDSKNKFNNYVNDIIPADDDFAKEYLDAITKVNSQENYKKFNLGQKDKLKLLLKCSWLAVICAMLDEVKMLSYQLPIDIYGKGLFSGNGRGKVTKPKPQPFKSKNCEEDMPYYSNHFGLMKCYMPVPRNDITYAEKGFTFSKPSDLNTFNPEGDWPKKNFAALVHPFSCSISGNLLAQLRFMKYLNNNEKLIFSDINKFMNFIKCFMSSLLYNSGGHTYNEFFGLLEQPEVRENFTFMKNFEKINAETALLNGNECAYNRALEDTIAYNKAFLAKRAFHCKLKK